MTMIAHPFMQTVLALARVYPFGIGDHCNFPGRTVTDTGRVTDVIGNRQSIIYGVTKFLRGLVCGERLTLTAATIRSSWFIFIRIQVRRCEAFRFRRSTRR